MTIIAKWDEPSSPDVMPILRPLPNTNDEWVNMEEWVFESETGYRCTVPTGFIFDLDSIPRIPFVYAMFKGRCQAAPLAHDWEFTLAGTLSQKEADQLLREIAYWEGTKKRYVEPIYRAVRIFGSSQYRKREPRYLPK